MRTEEDVLVETPSEESQVPEVEVFGEEAVIQIKGPEGLEERRVKLPRTTWG